MCDLQLHPVSPSGYSDPVMNFHLEQSTNLVLLIPAIKIFFHSNKSNDLISRILLGRTSADL